MSFIDHILAKHKFETVAVLILIAIFVVYIATRSVAIHVQAIPACFTVADQVSAPACAQGSTVPADTLDLNGDGNIDIHPECYCTVAPISIGDVIGNATGPNNAGVQGGGILFTTPADPIMNPNGAQLLAQDTTVGILFWDATLGYLGIGTSNPEEKLTVETVHNDYGIMHLTQVWSPEAPIQHKLATWIGNITIDATPTSVAGIGTKTPDPLIFFTNTFPSSPAMLIDTDGNVGIGDTSPDSILEVAGVAAGDRFMVSSTDAESANGDIFIIKKSGNVGILDTTPEALLEVAGFSGNISDLFKLSSTDTGNGDMLVVDKDGNVGIGIITPTRLLHLSSDRETAPLKIEPQTSAPSSPEGGDIYVIDDELGKFSLCFYNGTDWISLDGTIPCP